MAALRFLANHPATHRFLATKLVRHFVADDPPQDAVRRIEGVLRDTGGDLGAAAAALITLDAAWQPATKLRAPLDYVVACLRALDLPPEQRAELNLLGMLAGLGQPLWSAPQPNGWPDRAADWAAPGGDDAPDRLGLWRLRPRRLAAERARRGGTGRCRPRAAAAARIRCRRCTAPAPAATR